MAANHRPRRYIVEGGKSGDENLKRGLFATIQWAERKLSDIKPQVLGLARFLEEE